MRLLVISDTEDRGLWDYYTPNKLKGIDAILSCGDLKPEYLSFLVTMGSVPLFYVHGSHDEIYDRRPRTDRYGETILLNATGKYVIELPDRT